MILVDDLKPRRRGPEIFRVGSCHMVSDKATVELVEFAIQIGLREQWLQVSRAGIAHFDLTPTRRAAALHAGAKEVPSRELIRRAG